MRCHAGQYAVLSAIGMRFDVLSVIDICWYCMYCRAQAGDEADNEGDARSRKSGFTAKTGKTAGAKTARASQWGATDIFGADEVRADVNLYNTVSIHIMWWS